MAEKPSVDVAAILDEGSVNGFMVRLLVFSSALIFFDGFDINNLSFAVPALAKAWQISDLSVFGPVLAASLFGILIGAPVMGAAGDRWGRKIAIVISGLIFGAFTWGGALANSPAELLAMRILAGIGMGGVLPNIVALNAEYAPKRLRATLIVVIFTGVGFGSALPGPVAAWLVPLYGWQILFAIGGGCAILASLACLIGLPESVKYLALHPNRGAAAAQLLTRARPGIAIAADSVFVLSDEQSHAGASPKYLFQGGLAPLTLPLWTVFVTALMGYYFLISWMPTLLIALDMPVASAALATSVFQLGGIIGGWAVCRSIDAKGPVPVALLFTIAIPVVAGIGYIGGLFEPVLLGILFVAGFCVLGGQYSMDALSGMIYPTAFRSNGSGWAFAVGRVGSMLGPVIGGILIGMHLPARQLYLLGAIPFLACAPACFLFARRYNARFHAPRDAASEAVVRGEVRVFGGNGLLK